LPQLLNPIEEAEVELLLRDDDYCAQEKFDGRHLLVRKEDEQIEGINKKGLLVGLPQTVADDFRQFPGSFIPDGEAIGDEYHAFDLLEYNGENLRGLPYRIRLARLIDLLLLARPDYQYIKLVETAFSTRQKTKLWQRLRRENREGIVFKRLDAPYLPGKPSQGGPQLKFKFVATVSAVVTQINVQRSVAVGLFQGRRLVPCGNVTIPANTTAQVVLPAVSADAVTESGHALDKAVGVSLPRSKVLSKLYFLRKARLCSSDLSSLPMSKSYSRYLSVRNLPCVALPAAGSPNRIMFNGWLSFMMVL